MQIDLSARFVAKRRDVMKYIHLSELSHSAAVPITTVIIYGFKFERKATHVTPLKQIEYVLCT